MNQDIQNIINIIQQSSHLTDDEKSALIKSAKDADKALEIANFKLDRTEKVKRTTAILLEETIAELEQKRKAVEEHNRELEIEAALERVRSRSLAMHKSDELREVIDVVFSNLNELNISRGSVAIWLFDESTMNCDFWVATPLHQPEKISLPYDKELMKEDTSYRAGWNAYRLGKSYFNKEFNKLQKDKYFNYVFSQNSLATIPKATRDQILNSEKHSTNLVVEKHSALFFDSWDGVVYDEDSISIFKRISRVFEQAYVRFLDLQKAESQAREAEIELSLERVRSRAMAMQNSEELNTLIGTVFAELTKLDVSLTRCAILIYEGNGNGLRQWMVNAETPSKPMSFYVAHINQSYLNALRNAWKERKLKWNYILEGEEKIKTDEYLLKETELTRLPDFVIAGMRAPERVCISASFNNFGGITLASLEPLPDENFDILLRFAKVFDLTYTRFNDLQVAEARAREAQIEAALERVRSRSMAMHKSDELKEVIRLVLAEIRKLDILAEHAGFYIDYKLHVDMHIWLADPNIEPFFAILPYFDTPTWNSFVEAKAKGTTLHTDLLDFKEKNKFYKSLFKLFVIPEEAKKFYLQCKGLAVSTVLLDSVGLYIENFSGIPYSENENKVLIRFGKVFQQTYTRFLDLQKAEAQAREAQIQLALERVRAKSLAMHHTSELQEVVNIVAQQLQEMSIDINGGVIIVINNEVDQDVPLWSSSGLTDYTQKVVGPFFDKPIFTQMRDAIKKRNNFLMETYSREEKLEFFHHMFNHAPWNEATEERKKNMLSREGGYTRSVAVAQHTSIAITNHNGKKFSDENNEILKRFSTVLEQAYTRFLDLQKAEAQAREAQIEVALERVRSKTMAMHNSSELLETAELLFDQLRHLGAELQGVAFAICDENSSIVQKWTSIGIFSHPAGIDPGEHRMYEAWKNKEPIYEEVYEGEKQKKYYEAFMQIPSFKEGIQKIIDEGHPIPTWQKNYAVTFQYGYLLIITTKPFDETQIFLRFGKVFEQTYTRFLDLKKAEAQAREAQIEAALERVRTVALVMKKSDEMLDIARALYEQLVDLGFSNIRNAIIDLHNDKDETFWDYDYSKEMGGTVTLMSYYEDPIIEKQVKQIESASDAFFELVLEGDDLQYLIDMRIRNGEKEDPRLLKINQLTYNLYSFGNGGIGISNFGLLSDEHKQVLKRFRNVFALAYKRYTDMVQAELQAREAKIETALERVRNRTLAMQHSAELAETSAVLFKQLIDLGIKPNRLYICIVKDKNGDAEFWITDEDGSRVSMAYEDNLNSNPSFKKMFDGWMQQTKSLVIDMKDEELQEYFKYLNNIHVPFKDGLAQKRRLQYLAYFGKGFIGMASPEPQPAETLELLERFAAVFNLTYTRFNDLKLAEAHAIQAEQDLIEIKNARKKAEEALAELQSTQKQLIQSEKMASLGELTAGIAHEIQNPLNFVNNFSEVNKELIEELRIKNEELKIEDGEVKELLNDIKDNSEKINQHGQRAAAIVKGMLQHSRKSTGQKELTDINALCDEYLRLSYHGLRAKDKSFNAKFETNFDSSIPKINVVPQDIGRVILNLINNAFYAVNEKSKMDSGFVPQVTVVTRKLNDKIEISVKDNGNGIPEEIKDKIFQPFFTTKPTGSGTGLGLSLSYDIVKTHGGEIKVQTKYAEGTEIVILLPIS